MKLIALAGTLSLFLANFANAAVIVDTGTPVGEWRAYSQSLAIAGKFSINEDYTITDVFGYLANGSPINSTITASIRSDANNSPAEILYSQAIDAPRFQDFNWMGANGLNWHLNPGTYWVAFAGDNVNVAVPLSPPSPLDEYRFVYPDGGVAPSWSIGVRILGNPDSAVVATIPEPATWAIMVLGFGMIGGTMRYRGKRVTAVKLA